MPAIRTCVVEVMVGRMGRPDHSPMVDPESSGRRTCQVLIEPDGRVELEPSPSITHGSGREGHSAHSGRESGARLGGERRCRGDPSTPVCKRSLFRPKSRDGEGWCHVTQAGSKGNPPRNARKPRVVAVAEDESPRSLVGDPRSPRRPLQRPTLPTAWGARVRPMGNEDHGRRAAPGAFCRRAGRIYGRPEWPSVRGNARSCRMFHVKQWRSLDLVRSGRPG